MRKILPHIAFALMSCQLLLMPVSWLLSAAYPDSGIHSLLSGEGLRWFMGSYAHMMSTPLLMWLVLLSMSAGCLRLSGLLSPRDTFREGRALMITLLVLVVCVVVVVLLAFIPHALLLSATGRLWPSPFSAALIPIVAFVLMLVSAVYGIVSGCFSSLRAVYDALLYGLRGVAPLVLFYVLFLQLILSLRYVFPMIALS